MSTLLYGRDWVSLTGCRVLHLEHFSSKSCLFSSLSSIACSVAMKKSKVILIPEILSVCLCEPNVGFYFPLGKLLESSLCSGTL